MKQKVIGVALAFSLISTAFAANALPMTYAQMIKFIGTVGSSDAKVIEGLVGKVVALRLKQAGEKSYAVDASDMIVFICDSAGAGYKGGQTKGTITKYETSPDGLMIFSLGHCAK